MPSELHCGCVIHWNGQDDAEVDDSDCKYKGVAEIRAEAARTVPGDEFVANMLYVAGLKFALAALGAPEKE